MTSVSGILPERSAPVAGFEALIPVIIAFNGTTILHKGIELHGCRYQGIIA